jgi:glucarate dehydratase
MRISRVTVTPVAFADPPLLNSVGVDVIEGEPMIFTNGAVRVPDRPGLGVDLDRDALARLHEQYLRCGLRNRDDTGYMRRVDPGYERRQPRW